MGKPDIAIIINSFNRLSLLKECLGSLSAWLPQSALNGRCVAVIYDAGSNDGSIDWLCSEATKLDIPFEVILPQPGGNTSFAAGINTGVTYAERKFPFLKYLLFYETDNQILKPKPLLQAIAQLKKINQLAACGFTVRKHNGNPAGVGMPFPSLLSFALGKNLVHKFQLEAISYRWQKGTIGDTEFSEVDVVYTSPLLVRIDAWRESGGLDAILFPFSDCDVDWARRLRNLGWRMGVIRTDAVIHDNLKTLSSWSKSRALQFHLGRMRYFKKYHPVTIYLIWPFLLLIRHFMELLVATVTIKDTNRRNYLIKQFTDLIRASFKRYEST